MAKNQRNVCATCLSFSNFEFPMSEDIKGILRSLLYDCGFDEFIQAIPPDKQLRLCNTCNQTLRNMYFFKERAQNSFNEFKKFWCVPMHKPNTKHATSIPSNSQTETINPCYEIKKEDTEELKYEEPNHLEKTKPDPESITNIYDSLTDIKEEIDPNTLNQLEPYNVTDNSVAPRNYNFNQTYVYNIRPCYEIKIEDTKELKCEEPNPQEIAKPDQESIKNMYDSLTDIKEEFDPNTLNQLEPYNKTDDSVALRNHYFNQNCVLPVHNDIATLNYLNSSITHNYLRNNAVATTNSMNQHKSIFKSVSIDNGQVVLESDNKIIQIVKMDIKGNIGNVGQIIKMDPVPVSKDSPESTTGKGQKKWYISIVTREEILKKMEESRSHPDFLEAPYKCVSCVNLFPNESLAATHKEECHSEDFEFTCFACLRTFKQFHVLRAHYYVHSVDMYVYHCITCEFETRDFKHIKCHICPNAGSQPLPPKDPNMRLSNLRSLYYCHKCEYITARSSLLNTHYDTKHGKIKVKCADCGKSYASKYGLKLHMSKNNHTKVKCDYCGKFYASKSGLKTHIEITHKGHDPQGDPLYCNLCNKWFSNKITHHSHMRNIHTPKEELKFQCDECEKKFFTARQLEKHKKFHVIVKGGVKNHKCDVCGNAYYTRNVLRRHIAVTHENKPTSRDHVCEVCGMAFFTTRILKHHMAKHSDARPYKCSVCGDTFKYSGALFTHTKIVHKKKKTSEEPPRKKKKLEKPCKKENNSEESPVKEN